MQKKTSKSAEDADLEAKSADSANSKPPAAAKRLSLAELLSKDSPSQRPTTAGNATTAGDNDDVCKLVLEEIEKLPARREAFDDSLSTTTKQIIENLFQKLEIRLPGVEAVQVKAALQSIHELAYTEQQVRDFMNHTLAFLPHLTNTRKEVPEAILKQLTHLVTRDKISMLRGILASYFEYTKDIFEYLKAFGLDISLFPKGVKEEAAKVEFLEFPYRGISESFYKGLFEKHPTHNPKLLRKYLEDIHGRYTLKESLLNKFFLNKENLRQILDYHKLMNVVVPIVKSTDKASKAAAEEAIQLKEQCNKILTSLVGRVQEAFPEYSQKLIEGVLRAIEVQQPEHQKSSIEVELLTPGEKYIEFKHHNLIAYMMRFLDTRSILHIRSSSKIFKEAANMYLRKQVASLPLDDVIVLSNMDYWYMAMRFFFRAAARLSPLDRLTYAPTVSSLKTCRSYFPVSRDAMHSNLTVSLDKFRPDHIVYCDHIDPMPHTCSAKKAASGPRKVITEEISISHFVSEYYKRVTVNNDEVIWARDSSAIDSKFVSLMLWQFFTTLKILVEKQNGKLCIKRTEYLLNNGFRVLHRVWLQIFCQWGLVVTDEHESHVGSQRTLYLTVADHFRWDL